MGMRVYWPDSIQRGYVRWACRELRHGRDIRWALGTLWRMLGLHLYRGAWSYELAVGGVVLVYWHTPPPMIGDA